MKNNKSAKYSAESRELQLESIISAADKEKQKMKQMNHLISRIKTFIK